VRRNQSLNIAAIAGLILFFNTMSVCLFGQEQFVPPPAKELTKFSFKMLTGGIVIVTGTIDGQPDSLNFVFDTGSGGISLDSTTVERLHLKSVKTVRTIRGIGGMKEVSFTYGHTLNLPGLTTDSLDFHINDYELLTSVYGVRIDGVIGYSFLRRYIVFLNYDDYEMTVFSPGTYKYPKGGFLLKPNFTTLPIQGVSVKDEAAITSKFYFDTGAGLCMLFSEDFIQDSMLLRKKTKVYKTQGEGLGGKAQMGLTVIKEVKLGPYKFRRVPVYIFKDEYNVTAYPILSGLIGNDVLKRFNVTLNYPDQIFYLKPNSRFDDAFDYSYTGLGIYLVDNNVTVMDVLDDSPGKAAGFESGDVILAMNNNFSKDIQVYKAIIQNAGATVRVLVLREGQPKLLTLKVRDIR
jgi:hypothetical protein